MYKFDHKCQFGTITTFCMLKIITEIDCNRNNVMKLKEYEKRKRTVQKPDKWKRDG